MRAVDTNVVVRFLTGDDAKQAAKARAVIGREAIFVPRTVLLETEWVLRQVYGHPAAEVIDALRALAGLPGLMLEDPTLTAKALEWAGQGMDFADALHLAASAGCEGFLTFDKALERSASRMGVMAGTP